MTTFLVVLVIGSLISQVVLVALWKSTQLRENTALHNLNAMTRNYESACQALQLAEAARKDENGRSEKAIAALRTEIATLEGDLDACRTPDSVRDRLRKLLLSSVPEAPAGGAGVGPLGTVPYGGATKP